MKKLFLENDENQEFLLFVAKRLIEKFIFFTFNVKKRFWIIWLIDQIIKFIENIDVFKNEINWISNVNKIVFRNVLNWMRNIQKQMNENILIFEQFDAVVSDTFDNMKSFFDNFDYQKNNFQIAFENIDIVWQKFDTIFRISEMIVAKKLNYWQFTIIHWLKKMKENSLIKECIYANYMNFDKIWSVICFLLTINNMQKFFFLFFVCLYCKSLFSLLFVCLYCKKFFFLFFVCLYCRNFSSDFTSAI